MTVLPHSDRSRARGPRRSRLARIGTACARHHLAVLATWVIGVVAVSLLGHAFGGTYSDDFSLPGTQAQAGAELLTAHLPQAGGVAAQIVFHVPSGTLGASESEIAQAVSNVAHLPHVVAATNPFETPGTISKDGTIAYSRVTFDEQPKQVATDELAVVEHALAPATDAHVEVFFGGSLGTLAEPPASDKRSEVVGLVVALLVLLVGFGSVAGAALPLVDALVAVVLGLGLLGLVAALFTFATVSPTLALMIGLGVGIDYTLFLTTRFRQRVMDGAAPEEAAGETLATSGRSVLIAAGTVMVALFGLYASGIVFIGKLGAAAAIGVAASALSAMTLAPALLGLLGRRIDRLAVRKPVAETGGDDDTWHRYARSVERHPYRYLAGGLCILVLIAVPLFSMRLGHVGAGSNPSTYSDRQAYDLISKGFGPGANDPFTIVLTKPAGGSTLASVGETLQADLAKVPGVASGGAFSPSPDGAVAVATLVPTTGPQDAATFSLFNQLVDTTLPAAVQSTGASAYVTGATPGQLQFVDMVSARLPIIIVVVLLAAFLLLLASFRSLLLAAKAAVLNLLSIGAAYGVVVAVFQWGWGRSLIGVSQNVPVESYVPMMMFAITFGLAMDYEVFLLSRVREAYDRLGDNAASVAAGLAQTARVISCAALIMASVFFAFVASTNVVVKMLGVGLGASVLVDATVVRLVLVPATMTLFGKANWWVPRWLDRILPRLEAEGGAGELPSGPAGAEVPEPGEAVPAGV